MKSIVTRTILPDGTPEDLRVFAERMAAIGAVVRVSPPLEQTTIPTPAEATGRPLSEIIIAVRRDA
jgi:hypothetical protein